MNVSQSAKRFRKTQTLSLPPEEQRFMRAQAERYHGGNISRYIRFLLARDRLEQAQRERTQIEAVA